MRTNECLRTLTSHTDTVRALVWCGKKLYSGSSDGSIKVWLRGVYCVTTLTGHDNAVLALVHNGDLLYSGSSDGAIKVWDMCTLDWFL